MSLHEVSRSGHLLPGQTRFANASKVSRLRTAKECSRTLLLLMISGQFSDSCFLHYEENVCQYHSRPLFSNNVHENCSYIQNRLKRGLYDGTNDRSAAVCSWRRMGEIKKNKNPYTTLRRTSPGLKHSHASTPDSTNCPYV